MEEDGELTLAQAYQPYGETLNTAGDGASPYAFAGEWRDASGLDYLRARYYAPWQGRFLTKDAWAGDYAWSPTRCLPVDGGEIEPYTTYE